MWPNLTMSGGTVIGGKLFGAGQSSALTRQLTSQAIERKWTVSGKKVMALSYGFCILLYRHADNNCICKF
jgi:hypothetical protein